MIDADLATPDVWVVILSAGVGRRMQPLALDAHKALLPVKDSAGTLILLLKQLKLLQGIAGITLVTGYAQAEITSVAKQLVPDVSLVYNHNYASSSLLDSLKLGLTTIPANVDTLVLFADTFYADSAIINMIAAKSESAAVAIVDRRLSFKTEVAVTLNDSWVTSFNTDPENSTQW